MLVLTLSIGSAYASSMVISNTPKTNWDGTKILDYEKLNPSDPNNYPYKISEDSANWYFERNGDTLTLPKNKFSNISTLSDKISFDIKVKKSQISSKIDLPKSLTEKGFIFDNEKPVEIVKNTIINNQAYINYTEENANVSLYTKILEQIGIEKPTNHKKIILNINPQKYESLNPNDEIVFSFHSYLLLDTPDTEILSDSYVRSIAPNTVYGSSENFQVREDWGVVQSTSYISFNLSSLIMQSGALAPVSSATLYLKTSNVVDGVNNPIGAFGVNTSWDESTLTWNNQPCPGVYCNTTYDSFALLNISNIYYSWDITNTVNQVVSDNVSIYLNVTNVTGGDTTTNDTIFFSKEEVGTPNRTPYLEINYTPIYLEYPVNNSDISKTYPPITSEINFTWDSINYSFTPFYNIVICSDVNCNIEVANTFTENLFYVDLLPSGSFYWKVRAYDQTNMTYEDWSLISQFDHVNSANTGTGIQGVVYELLNSTNSPINGATVYISNNTWADQQTVGSNGYYFFSNLENSTTYAIYALKSGYDTTSVIPITTGNGTLQTKDIKMSAYVSPYVLDYVYETILIKSLFDGVWSGVTVQVYKGSDILESFSGVTDSMGQVVFKLTKDQYYRVVVSGGGIPSTITTYIYGKEDVYSITITSGFPDGGDKNTDINTTFIVTTINATHSNLSVEYIDNSSTTTALNFHVINLTNDTYVCNQNTVSQSTTLSCTVLSTGAYKLGYNATTTKYGFSQADKVVNFDAANTSAPQVIGDKVSSDILNWLSILGLIFVAGLFSIKTNKFGIVIIPLMATMLYWLGTLHVNAILVHTALVLGVLLYMRESEKKVAY